MGNIGMGVQRSFYMARNDTARREMHHDGRFAKNEPGRCVHCIATIGLQKGKHGTRDGSLSRCKESMHNIIIPLREFFIIHMPVILRKFLVGIFGKGMTAERDEVLAFHFQGLFVHLVEVKDAVGDLDQ